ncbi:MAG TPA: DUF91 domain-containing protein [Candidatus Nesterenkonia stercoripullorum]|uniref:DUF91 domain-containing protein n=1 Tax=Candidatus Nesterenkonia stercoripullorum TaxID=2838701 RepID=A0A9D1US44_9MICC|nr:DUF91 domain-containing protein [Candidatus Nesterenkonia stercoripullorum]
MPVEMGVWRIDGESPRRLPTGVLPSEAQLEEFLERDPSLLGQKLLIIGRQLQTSHGKFIDLLGIDDEGRLHVLELKRDRTPRDVVAQTLDYGSWAAQLDRDHVSEITRAHLGIDLEQAFDDHFGLPLPDEFTTDLQMTIVATELDQASERIVTFLREFGVPVNAVFFSYFEDDDRRYLGRSWLASGDQPENLGSRKPVKRDAWNGHDWFVTFGDGPSRTWEDARRHGFVSAGGGDWYSRTLRNLPEGARIFVQIPKHGYVAVGQTLAEATPLNETRVLSDERWVPLQDLPLSAAYSERQAQSADPEYFVPVRWIASLPKSQAFWEKGMFANQNSAGKLRQRFTLDKLIAHFALDDGDQ